MAACERHARITQFPEVEMERRWPGDLSEVAAGERQAQEGQILL